MKKQNGLAPRGWLAAAAFVFLGGMNSWAQAPARTPVEAFFQNPAFAGAEISPTGRHVAVQILNKTGRMQLIVMDTDNFASAKVVAAYSNGDVTNVHWVSDERLVYGIVDGQLNTGAVFASPGLFAVGRDGTGSKQLARMEWAIERTVGDRQLLDPSARFLSTMANHDSDDVYITLGKFSDTTRRLEGLNLLKLNTVTGVSSVVQRPGMTWAWFVDANDVPRASVTREDGRGAVQYMNPVTQKWEKLVEYDAATGEGGFTPVAFGPDGVLYVRGQREMGTSALYKFDPEKRTVDPAPVVAVDGFDFSGKLLMNKTRLLGLRIVTDAESTVWLDPELKAVQEKVDKLLPGTINRIDVPARAEVPLVLVRSFSDGEPGFFALYNTKTGKFSVLGQKMPGIEARAMAARDLVRYKARDGLDIPAWLTLPRGSKGKKLPLVVLVHGGPWVRGGEWQWDADSQFLASRGYAVLEPEYRGSQGYGFEHFKAGWKQWGLGMQNDLADGARWAIAQGTADPQRICIAGLGYGGYASLMGLVNDPALFKCAVDISGMTDFALLLKGSWRIDSTVPQEWKRYGMPALVGDIERDAAQLAATSPLLQARRITQPVLMGYGGADGYVPLAHANALLAAVRPGNPNIELVVYDEEGHGLDLAKNRIDFWTRVEKFLERSIGRP